MQEPTIEKKNWLETPIREIFSRINLGTILISLVILVAIISRFYNLGVRVMSHDEVNHVVPSYDLFQGRGYRHDPVTHGPFQFHVVALSYFLFGDNDTSSRTPAALFSIAAVVMVVIGFRRYLGRTGSLIAGLLFVISPYMLFYGRYTRNEAFIMLFGVMLLYGVLRYLEKGDRVSLYIITAATVLHFTSKETAYIYTAEYLVFCAILFLEEMGRMKWGEERRKRTFVMMMGIALVLVFVTMGMAIWQAGLEKVVSGNASAPEAGTLGTAKALLYVALGGTLLAGAGGIYAAATGVGWEELKEKRSLNLLMLVGTLILPLLSAVPVKLLGWNPLDYQVEGLIRSGIVFVIMVAASVTVGLWWFGKKWLGYAIVFWGIFIFFYTTIFTNVQGFFTGIFGGLGYWMEQQGVNRGTQPWYYFILTQVSVYEYVAVLGTILALAIGLKRRLFVQRVGESPAEQVKEQEEEVEVEEELEEEKGKKVPVLFLLLFWSLISLGAFTIAGEKMPWLTVHIVLAMELAAGWGLGYIVERIEWKKLWSMSGALAILLSIVFVTSLGGMMKGLVSGQTPFQGNEAAQLKATMTFVLGVIGALGSGVGLVYALRNWDVRRVMELAGVSIFGVLIVLTMRASYVANYVNYESGKEFLVYAHGASGPKEILAQVEEISQRIAGGTDIVVAYDGDSLYPYWWYFRNYANKRYYVDPTRDLKDVPLILVGEKNFTKMEPIVRDEYIKYEYVRLVWPMQDYYNLTWDRISYALTNPEMRQAIFQIWLNRDYTLYAQLTNSTSLTDSTWRPSDRIRLYIRQDIAAQIWGYGAVAVTPTIDPYEGKIVEKTADKVIGAEQVVMQAPRGVAAAKDGTIYVADSRNNRILHLSEEGEVLQSWGSYANAMEGEAAGGTFYEPWDVAVAPDGSVFVADTWNHRIQHFTAEGEFIKMWGHFVDQGAGAEGLWGPRGVAVDERGHVYVTDTGNKRVIVYDMDGNYIGEFGSAGMEQGQLDEPVGIDVGKDGKIYVADTWNQRIQVFAPVEGVGFGYEWVKMWDVNGWFGESLDNKPYLAVDGDGQVYVTDPEGYRVLEFSGEGEILQGWGDYSSEVDGFGLASGIAVDGAGGVWVSDGANNRLFHFTAP